MVSTNSSAGCPASSSAARTSGSGMNMPVAVSLCTTQTALMTCALSSASAVVTADMSTPCRQSDSTIRTSIFSARAIFAHSSEK